MIDVESGNATKAASSGWRTERRTFDLGFSLSLLAAVVRRGLMKTVIEADAVGPIDRQESRRGCLAANHRPLCKEPTLFSSLPLVRWDLWVDSALDTYHRISTLLLYRVKQTFITLIRPTSRIYSRCTRIQFIVASIESTTTWIYIFRKIVRRIAYNQCKLILLSLIRAYCLLFRKNFLSEETTYFFSFEQRYSTVF